MDVAAARIKSLAAWAAVAAWKDAGSFFALFDVSAKFKGLLESHPIWVCIAARHALRP